MARPGRLEFFPHTNMLIEFSERHKEIRIYVPEPGGNMVSYTCSHQGPNHVLFFTPTRGHSQIAGNIGRRTNSQHNVLRFELETGVATLLLPNGGHRTYLGPRLIDYRDKGLGKLFYLLEAEKFPSGHIQSYTYDQKTKHLRKIESTNPSGNKVYASIDVSVGGGGQDGPLGIELTTSDMKKLSYRAIRHENREYIEALTNSCRPHETYRFVTGRKGIGLRLASIDVAG
ncbi:MAG: hypothetical protein RL235_646, partial [Chlamydiota bacterium]